jgi:SAM-dependent methyltransferase
MERSSSAGMHQSVDNRPVADVVLGVYGYNAVLAAHRLQLFPLLADRPRALPDVCAALGIKPRPAQAILAAASALGFVQVAGGSYSLTPLSQKYLLETSPTYMGSWWDIVTDHVSDAFSYDPVERAVQTDAQQAFGGEHLFKTLAEQAEAARAFTRTMHSIAMAPALAWPDAIDLSGCRRMLDVGGGSGAHAIGAVTRWPQLRAVVYDLPPVCEVATEFIAGQGLQDRIQAQPGDMFGDPFPAADLHLYSDVLHDWSRDKCAFLIRKSFESLPPGGRIVLHEMLFDDDKTGPFATAAFNITMLVWSVDGEQYSGRELTGMLADAGFRQVETRPAFGHHSIVTAIKPAAADG